MVEQHLQSCVKTFLLSFKDDSQNVPLPIPKLHYGAIFQQAFPKTCQEMFFDFFHYSVQLQD